MPSRISTFAHSVYGRVKPTRQNTGSSFGHNAAATGFSKLPDPPLANQEFTLFKPKPMQLRRNMAEETRLQGLLQDKQQSGTVASVSTLTLSAKIRHFFINEGGRRTFFGVWVLLHAMVFVLGFIHYQLKDNQNNARATFGWTYPVARSAALVLHVDVAMLLLPVCRNFITLIRRTHLNSIIPFDANISFHKAIGWSIFFFSILHSAAHMRNFALFGIATKTGFKGFLQANFATGPGVTGWLMLVILCTMVWFAMEKRRRKNFERFWYSHHLFILFFVLWQLHGMFCMIKPDRPPYCDYWQIGVFWKYFLFGGSLFLYERVLREVRARRRTYISKVIQHPGDVVEVQIKRDKTTTRAGQYIFISCPEISYWQWHPFTLTSAPEEDFISVNIKMVGDWTKAFGTALGCTPGEKSSSKGAGAHGHGENELIADPSKKIIRKVLPRIMIDGPFGSASEGYHSFQVVLLCAAGIGVTPFASILKSIWYRMQEEKELQKQMKMVGGSGEGKRRTTRLTKLYFVWICRDTESVSWFRSLLAAIEAQDMQNHIEIMTYVTKSMKQDDMTNIMVSDVGNEKDAISGLRAPTHYGRPNWDKIFGSIRDRHPGTEVGTLFCGPKPLGSALHQMCNKWSSGDEDGTKFIWGKENF